MAISSLETAKHIHKRKGNAINLACEELENTRLGRFAPLWYIFLCSPLPVLAAGFALVLYATNRKQGGLIAVAVCAVAVVVHTPEVGVVAVLAGTPPVAVVADTAEIAIRTADAARQGRKPVIVCAVAIIVPTAR